ncbi:hypothetical protein [Sphingomonas faeni]|jgi:hypothetical protein
MTKTTKTTVARKPWVRPAVQKIAAGQAEVGTRTAGDGTFTTS